MTGMGPELLGCLFDEHVPALVLYARQWSDRPEDIVQDAFVALARQSRPPDRVVPWLYRVVRNGSIAAARGDRRRRRREALVSDREAWFASADERIDAAEAARLLADLEADAREVVVARLWGGLTFDEIARLQGCSLSAAHRRYQEPRGLRGVDPLVGRREPRLPVRDQGLAPATATVAPRRGDRPVADHAIEPGDHPVRGPRLPGQGHEGILDDILRPVRPLPGIQHQRRDVLVEEASQ